MNIAAYIVYLLVTYFITVHVGYSFYRHGRIYILEILDHDARITDSVNRLLLTGYYLLNLGYAALRIRFWEPVRTLDELLGSVASKAGAMLLLLSALHYINMAAIYLYKKRILHV